MIYKVTPLLQILADIIVLASAGNFLFFGSTIDDWHKFAYYIAGMSFGWYCTMRYMQIKTRFRNKQCDNKNNIERI